jgi:putative ABC transport system permease protein
MMPRFYRALLRLYPAGFRAEYTAELERAHDEAVRDRGRLGAAVSAVGDVVPNAIGAHWEILAQDLRYTVRSLRTSRGFALTTILVTALGVGANTATFSTADFALLRPLAFPEPDRLVRLCEGTSGRMGWGCMNELSPALFRDLATKTRSFAAVGAFLPVGINLAGGGEPVRIPATLVTPEVLPLLRVPPMIGRAFDGNYVRSDDSRAVVIGYGLWQSQFGGDTRIVGKTVTLDGRPFTVIGVMPPGFRFPTPGVQLWMPLVLRDDAFADRGDTYLQGIAQLRPGVTFEQARAELSTFAARLERDYPNDYREFGFSFFKLRDEMSPRYRVILWSLCGASLCLLLLTCANLANLSLARAAARERELAVRAALGAGRERLVRQMLTESLVLVLAGGVAGALAAALIAPLLAQLIPSSLPLGTQPPLDPRFFALAAGFAALTGLGFGLLPARRTAGKTGFAALREGRGGTRKQRLRSALVATEVAVSVILLVGSGLLIRAIARVSEVSPGFSTDGVLTLRTALPSPRYDSAPPRDRFYDHVLSSVRTLPGVESAAYTSGLPMVLTGGITGINLPGDNTNANRRDDSRTASYRFVSAQFFAALEIPIRRGRDVSETDTRGRPLVAVISESFAKRFWPNADPIGKVFETRGDTLTVVGVVGDVRVRGLERESEPQMYRPIHQAPEGVGGLYLPKDLVVRSTRNPFSLVPSIRRIVREADAQQPLSDIRMLADVVADQTLTRRTQIRVLGALAALALLLAGIGIHGLLAFTVSMRDREIGVRLALGAQPSVVGRMLAGEAVRMALLGIVPGVLIAYLAARAMGSMLFGVPPGDPVTFGAVALLCFATVAAGCARPAWRAAHIDPITALRAE